MTSSAQQNRDDFLTSRFLSGGFILNKDVIGDILDLVIPLPSIKSVLGESSPTPTFIRISNVCAYIKKDNVITVKEFIDWLDRNNDSNNYLFHTMNMKRFSSLCETEDERVVEELHRLEHLCVPNFTALVNFIENSCPLVGPSFKDMVNRDSSLFDLLELRESLI